MTMKDFWCIIFIFQVPVLKGNDNHWICILGAYSDGNAEKTHEDQLGNYDFKLA